ncbi:hypothetical protein KCP71_17440 [Salmonella enterica subsp. enterica]|nr:hypothetical protein KCP71_17440 [Salmonella enterica subsp. enterica]
MIRVSGWIWPLSQADKQEGALGAPVAFRAENDQKVITAVCVTAMSYSPQLTISLGTF